MKDEPPSFDANHPDGLRAKLARLHPAQRWLAKGRWAFLWRMVALWVAFYSILWLIHAAIVSAGLATDVWPLPGERPFTVKEFLGYVAEWTFVGTFWAAMVGYITSDPYNEHTSAANPPEVR